jgi:type I restriction enzyme S subunit
MRIEYDDIVSGTGELKTTVFEKISNKAGIEFHKGDVLYGKLRPYLQNWVLPSFSGLAVGDFWVLQPQDTDSGFLYNLIQTSQFASFANQSIGTKMPRADWNLISKTPFSLPKSITEQARIGAFFHNLDRLITLQQRKLAKLKNVKEALLEKMFPQEGESVPQIRFAGFNGAWEQKKFGQIFDYLWNNSMSRADLTYEKESIQNIHYGDVLIKFPEILDMEKEDVPYIMKRILNVSKNSLLKDGDIVVTDAAEDETVGKCCEMKNICDHKVVSGLHTIPCRPKVSFGTGYLGFYMNSSAYHNQLLRLIQGSKISSISKSALENTLIKYPRLIDEQLQIGKLFCDYNASIILQQQKIEKLQNFKKACLEKMFV